MSKLDELFKFTADDALAETKSEKKSFQRRADIYSPSIKDEKCTDMVYTALIRLMPVFDKDLNRKTTITRTECFLKDVNGENGFFVTHTNKWNPMSTMSYNLYKSDNAIDKENSKKINVYQQSYCLVEVIEDKQHPEYKGKFFIYKFGDKILNKISDAMEGDEYTDKINPFSFFDAPLFAIKITKDGNKKMENGNAVASYDSCKFNTSRTAPLHYFDENGNVKTVDEDDDESKKGYIEWCKGYKDEESKKFSAPDILDFIPQEWDSETTQKVNNLLATYKSGYTAPKSSVAKAQDIVSEMDEDNKKTAKKVETKVAAKKVAEPEPEEEPEDDNNEGTEVSGDDDAWLDSILNK